MTTDELLDVAQGHNQRHISKILLSRLLEGDKEKYIAAFHKDNPWAWWVAFQCLDAMKLAEPLYEYLLARIVAYMEASQWEKMRGQRSLMAEHILTRLPTEMIVPIARRWYGSDLTHLNFVGRKLLDDHANEEDIPRARSVIVEALPKEIDTYDVCDALDILAQLPDIGLLPEVEQVFVRAGYSHGRKRAAQAMRINAPASFAATYAYECLWDCEEEIRQLGCEAVALDLPGAMERMSEMADDPFEDDSLRDTARKRLGLS